MKLMIYREERERGGPWILFAILTLALTGKGAFSQAGDCQTVGPNGTGACVADGMFCELNGVPGVCHTTPFDPNNPTPDECVCDTTDPGEIPDGYRSVKVGPVGLDTDGDIQPGSQLHFTALLPAQMSLTKIATSAQVSLVQASLDISVSSTVSAAGLSGFIVTGGTGQFDPYVFGGQSIGASIFTVQRGFGWIRWADGRVRAKVQVLVSTAGFPNVRAVAEGSGSADFTNDTIMLHPDSLAVETGNIGGIPTLSLWSLAALTLALLGSGLALVRWR